MARCPLDILNVGDSNYLQLRLLVHSEIFHGVMYAVTLPSFSHRPSFLLGNLAFSSKILLSIVLMVLTCSRDLQFPIISLLSAEDMPCRKGCDGIFPTPIFVHFQLT